MLRIGLTGGIGAGKSTVAGLLVEHGAALVDADRIAREVVAPGEPLLAELAAAFGPEVITTAGGLDRASLAAAAFADEDSTARLNALMHPAIRERTREHFARHAEAGILVHDVPLLVETGMTAAYHLNLVVDVPAEVRLHRLVTARGMDAADARSRIARQAGDDERRAACDVVIDNSGSPEATRAGVEDLLTHRLEPFADNLAAGRRAPRGPVALIEPGVLDWQREAEHIIAKLEHGLGAGTEITHIGSTAVPGLPAEDVIDLQLLVADPEDIEPLAPRLRELGYPGGWDRDRLGEAGTVAKGLHANADPGRAVTIHVRTRGSAPARFATAFVSLLREDAGERERFARLKRELAAAHVHASGTEGYAEAKEPCFRELRRRLVPDSFA